MLSINVIKQAVVEANETEFSVPQDKSRLYEEYNQSFTLKYGRNFTKTWYGHLYDTVINEIISKYADESDERRALTVIINACGTNCDRNKIYSFCQRLSEAKKSVELVSTVNELTTNIKKVIKCHCLHYEKTTNDEYESYARTVLSNVMKSMRSGIDDDNRIHLFHLDEMRDDGENVYKKLAAISLIALIPNDANNEQMDEVRRFANAVHTQFSDIDKNSKLPTVEKINRDDIWLVGKKWYEQTKKDGSRFARLLINTDILPLAGNLPINVHKDFEEDQPLMDAINSTSDHMYLIGEGGIGKTTALYSIMNSAYENQSKACTDQIPIYIELSRANSSKDFDDGSSHFIINSILSLFSSSFGTKEDVEKQLLGLFSNRSTEKPEYVLLLDGLNEVSREELEGDRIVEMISREIRYIIKNYENVRVILTSRTKESLLNDKAMVLYLSGIKPETIEEYLKTAELSQTRIDGVKKNKQLMALLRIPLFLTLYTEVKSEGDMLTKGEILHAFFAQKRQSLYSERGRASMIKDELDDENSKLLGPTPIMICFLLDFVVPTIAWHMVENEAFQITKDEIKSFVESVLTDVSDTGFCSDIGKKCFSDYRISAKDNTRTIANGIMHLFETGEDDKWSNVASGICDCLDMKLGILTTSDFEVYEIIHQHIRDYFAALYHINKLKLAVYLNEEADSDLAMKCLNEWDVKPLSGQILTFIGEALGETHNVPKYDEMNDSWEYVVPDPTKIKCERNLIKRSLDIYRNQFDGSHGYSVWNLFQLLKLTRFDLSGEDFRYLDLTNCRANSYRLGNNTFAASFTGSILCDEFFMPFGHTNEVSSACFSPDEQRILTTSWDGTVKEWDAKTYEDIRTISLSHERICGPAIYSPNGKLILSPVWDNTVHIWDSETLQVVGKLIGHEKNVTSVEYSPNKKHIVTGSVDGTVKIWDAESYTNVATLTGHSTSVRTVQYSPDGKRILSASWDGTAKIWDVENHTVEGVVSDSQTDSMNLAQFSPTDKCILTVADGRRIKVYDSESFKAIGEIIGFNEEVVDAQYSHNGKYIISSYVEGTVIVWDAASFERISVLKGHDMPVYSAQFSNTDNYIVTASADGTAKVWDTKLFSEIPGGLLSNQIDTVNAANCSPDNNNIIIVSSDGTAKIWDAKTFNYLEVLKHKGEVISAQYSPDGQYILTVINGPTIKIWNAKNYEEIVELRGRSEEWKTAFFSVDGEKIYAISWEGVVDIWNANTFERISFDDSCLNRKSYKSFSLSPDGKRILATHAEGFSVFYSDTLQELGSGTAYRGEWINCATFSRPYGDRIATVGFEGTVCIWDTKSLKVLVKFELDNEFSSVQSVQYSPDGKYIVFAFSGGSIGVYSAETYNIVGMLSAVLESFSSVSFSLDGSYMMTTYGVNTAIWNTRDYTVIETIENCSGLEVINVDLRDISEESTITTSAKNKLKRYGAII